MLTDNQIFDILDGVASDEIRNEHAHLLIHSGAYRAYFEELEMLHLDLATMPMGQPSAKFTHVLLERLQVAPKTFQTKWLIIGSIAAGIIATIGFVFLGLLMPKSFVGEVTYVDKLSYVFNILSNQSMTFIFIAINAFLLLLIIDRKVLKPYFQKRQLSLHN